MSFTLKRILGLCVLVAGAAACSGGGIGGGPNAIPASGSAAAVPRLGAASGSQGPVLSTSDGGEIFGFDINQAGNDGVLAAWNGSEISVQTFDQRTGKITKTLAVRKGKGPNRGDDDVVDGIFAGDVALIDHQRAGQPGVSPAADIYAVMDPVTGGKLNQKWTPPGHHFNVMENAVNQLTSTSVVYGYERVGSDLPELIVSDIATNTIDKIIHLDSNEYSLEFAPHLAQDTVNNAAVMATSPSEGAAGGPPPIIGIVNLKSGKATQFSGVDCPGIFRCGYATGIAYDSNTGIACTTTQLDGGLEIYNVAQQTGTHEFLPGQAGELGAGQYVIVDQQHKLFLIAQPFSSTAPSGSSVHVYQEDGTLVESINGIDFTNSRNEVIPVRIAINPKRRFGWVNGPLKNQLQRFSY
jgi:hypothetical protein